MIVCLRVADAERVVPDSTQVPCPDCGHMMWASPVSQHMIANGVQARCSHCVRREHADAVAVTRGHLRELAGYLRRN